MSSNRVSNVFIEKTIKKKLLMNAKRLQKTVIIVCLKNNEKKYNYSIMSLNILATFLHWVNKQNKINNECIKSAK